MIGVSVLEKTLLTAATTGATNGTSTPIDVSGYTLLTIYVDASAALSAGSLIIEEAFKNPLTGKFPATWSQVTSNTLSTTFSGAGGQVGIHLQQSAYAWLRVRVGTTLVGGNVNVYLVGHE